MSCDKKILREVKIKAKQEIKRLIGLRRKFSWHESKIEAQMRRSIQEAVHTQIKMIRLINSVLATENIIEFDNK